MQQVSDMRPTYRSRPTYKAEVVDGGRVKLKAQAVGGPDGQAAEVPVGPGDEAVVEAGEQHEAHPGQGGGGGGQDVTQDVGGVVHIFNSISAPKISGFFRF